MRPTWLVWVEEMSNASPFTAGSWLWSAARLAISTPWRWWVAMSREKPTSTGPGVAASSPPRPKTTASPPPRSTSPTATTASSAVRRPRLGDDGVVTRSPGSGRCRRGTARHRAGTHRRAGLAGHERGGDELRVLAAGARFRRVLVVEREEVGELLDPLVAGRVDLQLVPPRLDADRLVQTRVGRQHSARLVLDQLGQGVDVGLAHVVGVVGDPDGTVLEAVDGVLVPDVDGVHRPGAVGPGRRRRVRPADGRGLLVVDGRVDVLLAGRVVVALHPGDLVGGGHLLGVGLVDLQDGVGEDRRREDGDDARHDDEPPGTLLGHHVRGGTGAALATRPGRAAAAALPGGAALAGDGRAVLGQSLSSMLGCGAGASSGLRV